MVALAAAVVVLSSTGFPSQAQDTRGLVRVLNGRADFRVRVQAAFALGNTRSESAIPPLERALRDSNPAVRAAAATALGRIASRRALPALRRSRNDASAAVRMQVQRSIRVITEERRSPRMASLSRTDREGMYPAIHVVPREGRIPWNRVRYVVTLGEMRNRSGFPSDDLADLMRTEVRRNLRLLRGVAVMTPDEARRGRAVVQIARRRLPKVRLEGTVSAVNRRRVGADLAVRCEVSFMLLDEPQQSLRGELRGAATGTEPRRRGQRRAQEQRLAGQALMGAVRSAMANASQAISRAARR